jgi:RND family efflux transporter MFP subunit
VTVAKPLQRNVVEWDEYTGRFDSVAAVDIRARISGYLNEVHFQDGQLVTKGDLLYSIDPRQFERALEQAKAELAQASTKVENTSLDVERGKPLVDRKIMSEKVFDDRANAMRDAQAQVKVADAKVKTAELDLYFTKITAPVTGRASRSSVSQGSWISAGAAANSTLLTSVVTEDPIHVYFDISENNWIKYRRMVEKGQKGGAAQLGTELQLALPDELLFPHKGKVDFLDNRLDQATGTLRARAIVDNKAGVFSAGMFARVRVQGSEDYSAVLLPDEAIGTDQTNKFVLTVSDDGTVGRKIVVLGPVIDGLRVIRTGLTLSSPKACSAHAPAAK